MVLIFAGDNFVHVIFSHGKLELSENLTLPPLVVYMAL